MYLLNDGLNGFKGPQNVLNNAISMERKWIRVDKGNVSPLRDEEELKSVPSDYKFMNRFGMPHRMGII